MAIDGRLTFSVRVGSAGKGVKGRTERAVQAEALGFDQVWAGNDIFGYAGIAGLASMLMATTRITVGSGVLDPVSIHPAQLAQLASGFQELSNDRFILGIGAGSDIFFGHAGITPEKPLARTRDAVVAVRELTNGRSPAGGPGTMAGWTAEALIREPRPVPIYVGAMGPKLLEMTGQYADGALPLCLPPRHVHNVVKLIARGASRAGRSIDDLDVAACIWCSIGSDRNEARRMLARHVARYSGSFSPDALDANGLDREEFALVQTMMNEGRDEEAIDAVVSSSSMLQMGVVGGAAEVLEQCGELLSAGARHISFGPPLGPDPSSAMEIIGAQVLPGLRALSEK